MVSLTKSLEFSSLILLSSAYYIISSFTSALQLPIRSFFIGYSSTFLISNLKSSYIDTSMFL